MLASAKDPSPNVQCYGLQALRHLATGIIHCWCQACASAWIISCVLLAHDFDIGVDNLLHHAQAVLSHAQLITWLTIAL